MSYQWYAEYDPFFTAGGSGPDSGAADAERSYNRYVSGEAKLGPKGERARCGWMVADRGGGGFTDPATPNYVCSKKPPRFVPDSAPGAPSSLAPISLPTSTTPMAIIAIGAIGIASLYLLSRSR